MRALVAAHDEVAQTLDALEQKLNQQFRVVFEAIRQMAPPVKSSVSRIGCRTRDVEPGEHDTGNA